MSFEVVIGIEIHCELLTKTKMFSAAPVTFGEIPNTQTSVIDLAHPGTLPSVNKEAIAKAVATAHALNCEIDTLVKFDRKNYYYSDLPKGFQITQQFHPIGTNGYIITEKGSKIRINRIHMEEDTAKQFHEYDGTAIDFNRAGVPLIEIVSEADIRSAEEAMDYVNSLRMMLEYLEVSDVKMEEGSLRCDINVSLRPFGYEKYGTKVEIKNMNSISNIDKALRYEIKRQKDLILAGEEIVQETRRYDDERRITVSMRKKEGAVDYKYFPEPNITPIRLDTSWIEEIITSLPELPNERRQRYLELGLSEYDASILSATKALSNFYDEVLENTKEAKLVANWVITELMAYLNKNSETISGMQLQAVHLAKMVEMIASNAISGKQAKEVFAEVLKGEDPEEIVKKKGMAQESDQSVLVAYILEALDENPQSIEDYHNGKERAVGFLVGQVMKKSQGKANPALTSQLVLEELQKRK